MLGGTTSGLLMQVFGFAYPGYMCYKDVQKPAMEKLRRWGMYWVLMAAFMAVQPFADTFLSFIPMYYSAKVAFAVYLWFNDLAGAELVYTKFFHPFLAQHEPLVDAKLNESRGVIAGQVTTYTALFMDKARGTLLTLFTQTTQAAVGTLPTEPALAGPERSSSFSSATSNLGSFRSQAVKAQ